MASTVRAFYDAKSAQYLGQNRRGTISRPIQAISPYRCASAGAISPSIGSSSAFAFDQARSSSALVLPLAAASACLTSVAGKDGRTDGCPLKDNPGLKTSAVISSREQFSPHEFPWENPLFW